MRRGVNGGRRCFIKTEQRGNELTRNITRHINVNPGLGRVETPPSVIGLEGEIIVLRRVHSVALWCVQDQNRKEIYLKKGILENVTGTVMCSNVILIF